MKFICSRVPNMYRVSHFETDSFDDLLDYIRDESKRSNGVIVYVEAVNGQETWSLTTYDGYME